MKWLNSQLQLQHRFQTAWAFACNQDAYSGARFDVCKQSNISSWSIHHHQSSTIYHHDQYIIIKAVQYIIMINTSSSKQSSISSWSIHHHQSSPVYHHDQYIIIKAVQYIIMINTSSSKQSKHLTPISSASSFTDVPFFLLCVIFHISACPIFLPVSIFYMFNNNNISIMWWKL